MEEKKVQYQDSSSGMATLSAIASVLALVGVGYAIWGGGIQGAVDQALSNIEAQKVGWVENYALVQKIFNSDKFKETQKQQLEMAITQMGASDADMPSNSNADTETPSAPSQPQNQEQAQAPKATELTDEQIASLKKDAYVKGDENATISVVEFSDLECPFCARLHTAGTPKALADKYGKDINFVFKHFPLGFHANAQKAGEWLECVGELGGADKFYAFIDSVFKTGGKPTQEVLKASAKEVGVDETKFTECLSSDKYAQKVKDSMAQGSNMFGIQGTPNTIIINNKTKKYDKVEGAYPTDAFVAKIDALMK